MQIGQAQADASTPGGSSTIQTISLLYGPSLSKELVHVIVDKQKERGSPWMAEAYASSANYQAKKFTLLLFINR